MSASLAAKTNGAASQYGISGTVTGAYDSTKVTPRDTGTILGTTPPGQAGIKLVSGVIQNATTLTVDGTAGATGNALLSTTGSGLVPTVNSAQLASNGLSLSPQTE